MSLKPLKPITRNNSGERWIRPLGWPIAFSLIRLRDSQTLPFLAALLADVVLLPAGPSPLDVMAAGEALESAREARAQRDGKKPLIRFIPCKTQSVTTMSRDLAGSLAKLGEQVLPAIGLRVCDSRERPSLASPSGSTLAIRQRQRNFAHWQLSWRKSYEYKT